MAISDAISARRWIDDKYMLLESRVGRLLFSSFGQGSVFFFFNDLIYSSLFKAVYVRVGKYLIFGNLHFTSDLIEIG